MWILSASGTSKIIFTSAVVGATRTHVSLIDDRHFVEHFFRVKALAQRRSKSSFPRIGREDMIGEWGGTRDKPKNVCAGG